MSPLQSLAESTARQVLIVELGKDHPDRPTDPPEVDVEGLRTEVERLVPGFDYDELRSRMVQELSDAEDYLGVVAPELDRSKHKAWLDSLPPTGRRLRQPKVTGAKNKHGLPNT